MITRTIGSVDINVQHIAAAVSPLSTALGGQELNCYKYNVSCVNKETGRKVRFFIFSSLNGYPNNGDPYYPNLMNEVLSSIKGEYPHSRDKYPNLDSFCEEFGWDILDEGQEHAEKLYRDVTSYAARLQDVFPADLVTTFPDSEV